MINEGYLYFKGVIAIDHTQIPKEVLSILTILQSNNYQSFLVGGCVRDLFLNKQPKDYDICTIAHPVQVKKLFPKVIETGIKYGTVNVLSGKFSVEVTTFRQSVLNPDGHRASEITYGTKVSEDVLKRDFTINALLSDGTQVVDYVGGQADLENSIIRAVEDPDARFREDPLRMIRAVRFSCRLGFEIETNTLEAIKRNVSLIINVSPERIRDEFNKILLSDRPDYGFQLLHQMGLLKLVLPELEQCYGFEQHNPYHSQDVFGHILTVVHNTPLNLKIRWAALLHDIGKPLSFSIDEKGIGHFYGHNLKSCALAKEILNRLKFDNKKIRQVLLLIKEHMSKLTTTKRSTIKRLINRVGIENINELLELQIADVKRPETMEDVADLKRVKDEVLVILQDKEPINPRDLAINGDDLKAIGIKPGKVMGQILAYLMEKVIDDPGLNNKEDLLAIVEMELYKLN